MTPTLLLFKRNFWYLLQVRFRHSNLPLNDKYKSLQIIIRDVQSENRCLNMIPNFENNIQKAINYSGRSTNNNTSISNTMLTAYNMIENSENMTAELDHKAFVLAWAAEMVDSYKIVRYTKSDHEEESKQNFAEVTVGTVRDPDLLRSFIYVMVEQHFQDTKWYRDILKLYNKAFLYNVIGQYLDHSSRKPTSKCDNLNAILYEKLCDYKVSYPYFQFPLLLALTLSNKTNMELLQNVEKTCSEIGMLYQIQNDFGNCFGSETIIGTEGTDIQEGKCTWLAVTALHRCTPRQRVVFEACYGSEEPAHIERVKLLYQQLQLPRLYREREGNLRESIMQQAETFEKSGIPPKLFEELLGAIRK